MKILCCGVLLLVIVWGQQAQDFLKVAKNEQCSPSAICLSQSSCVKSSGTPVPETKCGLFNLCCTPKTCRNGKGFCGHKIYCPSGGQTSEECPGEAMVCCGGATGKISSVGIDMITRFEGFSARFYWDHGANAIGYGYNCGSQSCQGIKPPITKAFAKQLLMRSIVPFENCVKRNFGDSIPQNVFDALTSFAFNLGCGVFRGSSLLKAMQANNYDGAARAMCEYVNASGRRLPGLVRRSPS